MDKLLEDYKAYYLARSKRYAQNPHFKRSAASEKALSDAMQSCSDLNETKDKFGNLPARCATALLLDHAEYRQQVFADLKETVRAKGNAELLKACLPIENTTDLIRVSSEILLENNKEISEDMGTLSFFKSNLTILENIEAAEKAVVSGGYESDVRQDAQKDKTKLKAFLQTSLDEFRKYHPTYTFNWDNLWEHRHRCMIPVPDQVLTQRITQLKNILND